MLHWRPTETGYVLDGYAGTEILTRTAGPRGRASWTLTTDAGDFELGRRAQFGHAEKLLGLE